MDSGSVAPLCFNRADFTKADFNVDTFLTTLKKHASFEQMQTDLRVYLKIIQNAMIELINQDYADFVNLSSSLVNLRPTIDKLGGDLQDMNDSFLTASTAVAAAVDEVSIHATALESSVQNQTTLESQLYLLRTMSKINCTINKLENGNKSPVDYGTIRRLSRLMKTCSCAVSHAKVNNNNDTIQNISNVIDKHHARMQHVLDGCLSTSVLDGPRSLIIVLDAYDACSRKDAALATFIDHFLNSKLQELQRSLSSNIGHGDKLDSILTLLNQLREQYSDAFSKCNDLCPVLMSFVDSCLLTVLLDILDDQFSSVLIPSDAQAFHRCYTSLERFALLWPVPNDRLLRMAVRKFSLMVYLQLRSNQIRQPLNSATHSPTIVPIICMNGKVRVQTEASRCVVEAVELMWEDNVLLTPLVAKTWDLTCKLITQFNTWVQSVVNDRQSLVMAPKQNGSVVLPHVVSQPIINGEHNAMANGDGSSTMQLDACKQIVLLLSDLCKDSLGSALFDICFEKVWPKLRDLGIDPTPFGKCIFSAVDKMEVTSESLTNIVVNVMAELMTKDLNSVAEIPRQYRWTRKEAPTCASPYLQSAFSPILTLVDAAHKAQLDQSALDNLVSGVVSASLDVFIVRVQGVLVSVDKISSSLSKLKKKTAASDAAALTDDQKIRMQLRYDMKQFESVCIEMERVEISTDFTALHKLDIGLDSENVTLANSVLNQIVNEE